jgi:hypothetical protein
LAPSRRSGELWKGIEHQEVARDGGAASRRSGELWKGIEHQEVARDGEEHPLADPVNSGGGSSTKK